MAVDLEVQRLQNKTIWLQNAQRELENVLLADKAYRNYGLGAKKQKGLVRRLLQRTVAGKRC